MWGQVAVNIMKGTLKLLNNHNQSLPFTVQSCDLRSALFSDGFALNSCISLYQSETLNPSHYFVLNHQSNPIPFAFRLPVPYTSIPIPILSYPPLVCPLFLQQSNTQTLNICALLLQSSAAAAAATTKLKGAIGSNRNDSTWEQCLD